MTTSENKNTNASRVYIHDMRDQMVLVDSYTLVCLFKDETQPTCDIKTECEPFTTLSDAIRAAEKVCDRLYTEDNTISSITIWVDDIYEVAWTERAYDEVFEGLDLDTLRECVEEEEEYYDEYAERMAEYRAMVEI
jgi:hypothetical protein